jgi:hypothetical protein
MLRVLVQDLMARRHEQSSSAQQLKALAKEGTLAARTVGFQPATDTLLHALLGRFTLHTHPIAVTALACRRNWQDTANRIAPSAYMVSYATPGYPLALALWNALPEWDRRPSERVRIFILQNNGLVVAGPTARTVMQATDDIANAIAHRLGLDLARFNWTNKVSRLISEVCGVDRCAYLVEDVEIRGALDDDSEQAFSGPALPDQASYCGAAGVVLESLQDRWPLRNHIKNYGAPPRVVMIEKNLFLLDTDIDKCREMEEVLKAHLMTLRAVPQGHIIRLTPEEIADLLD